MAISIEKRNAAIPLEMRERKQWITWRFENGDKRPKGKWGDESHWKSFDQVSNAPLIGFVFSPDDPFTGVDLDDCIVDGSWAEWATQILDKLIGKAYGEISPSGKGIKFWTRARKPDWAQCADHSAGVECYDKQRWFAVTGDVIQFPGFDSIGDGQDAVDWVCSMYLLKRKAEIATTTTSASIPPPMANNATTRASKYVAKMPPSISGSGGHNAAFEVACALVKGFVLSIEQARAIFVSEYNPRCVPPWSDKEIEHKLKSAAKSNRDAGYLLNNSMPAESEVDISRVLDQGERQLSSGGEIQDEPEQDKLHAKLIDPAVEAMRTLESHRIAGFNRLVFWSGGFFYWKAGRFSPIPNSEARALVANSLDENYTHVGCSDVSDVLEHVRAKSVLSVSIQPPSWLRESEWSIEDIVVTKNKIVHLPTFLKDPSVSSIPSTPALFSTVALDYEFATTPPEISNWSKFLRQLWPSDQQSIDLLQEWFGYCLTPDTRQQKMLMMLGPKRSGKGTICRVLRSVVGDGNVAGPTLASIQTNFGLWPLLGKSVAIVSDARLSGRADQAIITERLLSISGEDAQTIDRKNLEPVTTKLQTRFMIVSNELPRLQDSSGALVGRMMVLRLVESFYGGEDKDLSKRLMDERAGILHWAIEGWKRLRERGSFVQPKSGLELLEQMDELSSPILSFVEDRCEVGDNHSVSVSDLYQGFSSWCKEVGREPATVQTFGRDLVALLPRLKRRQLRAGAHRERFYDGIRLYGGGF